MEDRLLLIIIILGIFLILANQKKEQENGKTISQENGKTISHSQENGNSQGNGKTFSHERGVMNPIQAAREVARRKVLN